MQIDIHPDVRSALSGGRPVVALESTLIAHGLPRPSNREVAARIEDRVRACGAQPATVAVLDGRATIGLDDRQLDRIGADDVVKLSERDLAVAAVKAVDGATTVAATASLASRVGIRVFATGGLGGVHRDADRSWDVSADLTTLARTPIVVVCAGVKSILDVPATLEHLETLGVPVVGYCSERFAGFYLADSGHPVPWTVDDAPEIARIHQAQRAVGSSAGLVVANPLPPTEQLDPGVHDDALASGMRQAAAGGVRGAALTPFLLDHFHQVTGGRSLDVNVELVLRNVTLGAEIAAALAS
ncbi:MAG: pseudouridine-5'-phosphate glycosidase [Actinobacteria bacterium]|nr:pseudouridine-5'-phosphate glycosidase [Actinomycetota bacterium]